MINKKTPHKQVYDASKVHIGTFDGEYVYDHSNNMLYRVDGDEVYTMNKPAKYIGVFNDNEAKNNNDLLFRVEE